MSTYHVSDRVPEDHPIPLDDRLLEARMIGHDRGVELERARIVALLEEYARHWSPESERWVAFALREAIRRITSCPTWRRTST